MADGQIYRVASEKFGEVIADSRTLWHMEIALSSAAENFDRARKEWLKEGSLVNADEAKEYRSMCYQFAEQIDDLLRSIHYWGEDIS